MPAWLCLGASIATVHASTSDELTGPSHPTAARPAGASHEAFASSLQGVVGRRQSGCQPQRGLRVPSPTASKADCKVCDEFASSAGVFVIAAESTANSMNQTLCEAFYDRNWTQTTLAASMASIISSLGRARPASFFRQGLPSQTYSRMPGVIVGRSNSTIVTASYAFDSWFRPYSVGGHSRERRMCTEESTHWQQRLEIVDRLCNTSSIREIQKALASSRLNCRFSSLDAMLKQQEAFERANTCAKQRGTHNQISLQYRVDDLRGVIYMEHGHLLAATEFVLWLRQLTGRYIELVQMTGSRGCTCIELAPSHDGKPHVENEYLALVGAATRPLSLPQLEVSGQSHVSDNRVCAEHWCNKDGHRPCCPQACRAARPERAIAPHDPKPHPVFIHIADTGGNPVECASEEWERAGRWTNMGYASSRAVQQCTLRCNPATAMANIVVLVRNPYDYWLSVYHHAIACLSRRCSSTANYLQAKNATSALATFTQFMQFMETVPQEHGAYSQTAQIKRSCGTPCRFHYLLRSETLVADFIALLGHFQLPLQALPHSSETPGAAGYARVERYTPKVAAIVQRLEALLFAPPFMYSRSLLS